MRSFSKLVLPLALVTFCALAIAACGGLSDEDAAVRCDIEQANNSSCFNQAAYDSCVSCFSECGDNCAIAESCPVQYVCAE